jgi:hypothetical protein
VEAHTLEWRQFQSDQVVVAEFADLKEPGRRELDVMEH